MKRLPALGGTRPEYKRLPSPPTEKPFCFNYGTDPGTLYKGKSVCHLCGLEAKLAGKADADIRAASWFADSPEQHVRRMHSDETAAHARLAVLQRALFPHQKTHGNPND